MEKTKYYSECPDCEGTGFQNEYCCSGIDPHDGSVSCGCYGRGTDVTCSTCDETGKIYEEEIKWDEGSLEEEDRHDHEIHYSVLGEGQTSLKTYVATVIYTDGILSEITDVEPY